MRRKKRLFFKFWKRLYDELYEKGSWFWCRMRKRIMSLFCIIELKVRVEYSMSVGVQSEEQNWWELALNISHLYILTHVYIHMYKYFICICTLYKHRYGFTYYVRLAHTIVRSGQVSLKSTEQASGRDDHKQAGPHELQLRLEVHKKKGVQGCRPSGVSDFHG